jgi:hypothetical protein
MLTSGMRLESVTPTEDGSTLNSYVPLMEEEELLTVYGEVEKGVGTEDVTLVDAITTSRTYGKLQHSRGQQRLQALYAVRGAQSPAKISTSTESGCDWITSMSGPA